MGRVKKVRVGYFRIEETLDGAIVHNTRKKWEKGHTHIHDIGQGIWLAKMCMNGIIPRRCCLRDIESLIRIAKNAKYIGELHKEYEYRMENGITGYHKYEKPKKEKKKKGNLRPKFIEVKE